MEEIKSVSDLLQVLQTGNESPVTWFRGQVDATWRLEAGVARNRGWIEGEEQMLKRFKQEAASRLSPRPADNWDWLSLAQHNGLPTRLLDWSENPLVGLYFAVEVDAAPDSDSQGTDGRLWSLQPEQLNQENVSKGAPAVLLLGHDVMLNRYEPGATEPKMGPLAVVAPRSFDRIAAQSGTYTLFHREDLRPLDETTPDVLESWIVPLTAKERIRNELDALNINAATVYPDLSHLGERLKSLHRR